VKKEETPKEVTKKEETPKSAEKAVADNK